MSKKQISAEEFEKRVEIEYEFLRYAEYMKKEEAWSLARRKMSDEYEVVRATAGQY